MTSEGPKTPEEYFSTSRDWLIRAERIAKLYDKQENSGNMAVLAMANALLGICAQFIREQEDD